MSVSVLYMAMSLDGYIAGPNDAPDNPAATASCAARVVCRSRRGVHPAVRDRPGSCTTS